MFRDAESQDREGYGDPITWGGRIASLAGSTARKYDRMSSMPDTVAPAEISHLTEEELLSLYLSLSPALREQAFIGTAQAAEITGVSMRTIQLWIESGAVRAIVIGRKYRVVLESLKAHLEGQINKRASLT
jgi:excisionase family DNA binding protein